MHVRLAYRCALSQFPTSTSCSVQSDGIEKIEIGNFRYVKRCTLKVVEN